MAIDFEEKKKEITKSKEERKEKEKEELNRRMDEALKDAEAFSRRDKIRQLNGKEDGDPEEFMDLLAKAFTEITEN